MQPQLELSKHTSSRLMTATVFVSEAGTAEYGRRPLQLSDFMGPQAATHSQLAYDQIQAGILRPG